jgi:murein DD-endopeptidase MepM/ murein hydrolase activator NlpD
MLTKIQFGTDLATLFAVFLSSFNANMRMTTNYTNNTNDSPSTREAFVSFACIRILALHCSSIGIALGLLLLPFKLGSAVISKDKPQPQASPKVFPQGYFVEPTDSSLSIAGNFGEIRPNHFHAGIDVKTAGREGLMVYAAASGYVSRIKISATGYGKSLYITHPNGFVTVYGHLQRLYGKIAEYTRNEQYKFESYEVDINVPKDVLRVNQCDTIAISGNTGGSQSPHLHFEIRDATTENAYNPFLFGFKIKDTVPPKLMTLALYPANDSSSVNGKNTARKTKIYGSRGKYKLSAAEKITVNGDIGFGIETYDYANIAQAGKLGAYSIELEIDGQKIYYHEMNEIAFDESRYINSHIDYNEEARSNREIQKCFRDENNRLSIYQCVVNEGLYRFADTLVHPVKFIVKDFFGNASVLEFNVKSSRVKEQQKEKAVPDSASVRRFRCMDENKYETGDFRINIPPCAMYSSVDFRYYESKDTLPRAFSPVHSVRTNDVPLHYACTLSIKVKDIPVKYRDKSVIVLLDGKNNMSNQKGVYEAGPDGSGSTGAGSQGAGWVTTQTKNLGRFDVVLDTVAPSIKPYNIFNGKNMGRAKTISVIVGDNLTGIGSYRATIDGKWVLMEYEPKKALLFYEFDDSISKGKHVFEVEVKDTKDNARKYKADFVR